MHVDVWGRSLGDKISRLEISPHQDRTSSSDKSPLCFDAFDEECRGICQQEELRNDEKRLRRKKNAIQSWNQIQMRIPRCINVIRVITEPIRTKGLRLVLKRKKSISRLRELLILRRRLKSADPKTSGGEKLMEDEESVDPTSRSTTTRKKSTTEREESRPRAKVHAEMKRSEF
eukprot:TRINITY_DN930_c0_g1_i1.p1 TRINITY_DN930_c0_g1~~TRINITY_DN930_c0_g1_i1.p1  ORF type:complete len:174 (-),score=25.02 TRINITY_DN930_c0_g1_i1:196-717(-)